MPKPNGQRSKGVQMEAAKHATPESIRQRIAYEEGQMRALANVNSGRSMEKARKDHFELIQVLPECHARRK